jgi:hypothetical protein
MIRQSIVAAFLVAMSSSTLLMADKKGSLFSYQIGYSTNTTHAAGADEPEVGGFYNGIDLMATGTSGFGMGVGFDINIWNPENFRGVSRGHGIYTMGSTLKIGYTFQNRYDIPLKLKAGIGYGVMDVTVHDGWGKHYEAGGEYLLSKNLGVGVKYKYAQADMLETTIRNDAIVYYLMFGY